MSNSTTSNDDAKETLPTTTASEPLLHHQVYPESEGPSDTALLCASLTPTDSNCDSYSGTAAVQAEVQKIKEATQRQNPFWLMSSVHAANESSDDDDLIDLGNPFSGGSTTQPNSLASTVTLPTASKSGGSVRFVPFREGSADGMIVVVDERRKMSNDEEVPSEAAADVDQWLLLPPEEDKAESSSDPSPQKCRKAIGESKLIPNDPRTTTDHVPLPNPNFASMW